MTVQDAIFGPLVIIGFFSLMYGIWKMCDTHARGTTPPE